MAISLAEVVSLLCCPDDGGRLRHAHGELQCGACERRFPIHGENLIEVLPGRRKELPSSISSEYRAGYKAAFNQKYQNDRESLAWGAEESMAESWSQKRRRQVEFVLNAAFSLRGLTSGALVGGLTLAVFWRQGSPRPVIAGMLVSLAVMTLIQVLPQWPLTKAFWMAHVGIEIFWPWFTLIGALVTLGSAYVVRRWSSPD